MVNSEGPKGVRESFLARFALVKCRDRDSRITYNIHFCPKSSGPFGDCIYETYENTILFFSRSKGNQQEITHSCGPSMILSTFCDTTGVFIELMGTAHVGIITVPHFIESLGRRVSGQPGRLPSKTSPMARVGGSL